LSHAKMEGCRGLIRQYKGRVHRHLMNTDHVLRDIDTPEEYERYFVDQPV
jgi:CTP:molybdopterin cytidylyltransferase MocA